jgi:hypothetical protein
MRAALGQCGENSTQTPAASRTRRALSAMPTGRANARPMTGSASSGAGARAWVQVTLFQHTPAVPRPRSLVSVPIPHFSGLRIVTGCPWHDIRIATDAGGHWRNISSELPASVSKWAKSYNSSRSLPPTGRPVSFKRPARYTRAFSQRRPPVSRQSKMTILRPDFSLGNGSFNLDLVGRVVLAALLFLVCR